MIERWDYIDFRIVSFLSRARKGKLHYPWGAWKHRLDVLTLWEASKVRCDLSMRHQLCLIRSNGDMVQDWPCIALNPPYDIPKISKILELRESMQCEDKDPTLYHLALARRGCWIIYRILISIPDCQPEASKSSDRMTIERTIYWIALPAVPSTSFLQNKGCTKSDTNWTSYAI